MWIQVDGQQPIQLASADNQAVAITPTANGPVQAASTGC